MNKKTVLILILALSLVAIFASQVSAAPNMFEQLFKPFGNLEQAYDKYFPFIDMIIYLIIFMGLVQATIGRKFEGKGGKLVSTGIGIIFAVSLALWEKQANFNIKTFGPIAMAALIAVMCFALYQGMRSFDLGKGASFAISYIAFFSVLGTFGVMAWVSEKTPILALITSLLFFAAIIVGILEVVKWIGRLKGGGGESAAEIGAELKEEENLFIGEEAEIAADIKKEVNPEVKQTMGQILKELALLSGLLRQLEQDVKIHDKIQKRDAKLYAKKLPEDDVAKQEAKNQKADSKKVLNFDTAKIEEVINDIGRRIAAAKQSAQSIAAQANLKKINKSLAKLETRLKNIVKWAGGA